MYRKLAVFTVLLTLAFALLAAPVEAAGPNFSEAIYADGVAWGTKGLGNLPAPNGSNNQSFDLLFGFSNGVAGQLPVSEAGPGNPDYNGGRWNLHTATWAEGVEPVLITSYSQLLMYVDAGALTIESAETYFLCPLLPVK